MSISYEDIMGTNTDYSTHDEKVIPVRNPPYIPRIPKEDMMDSYKTKEPVKLQDDRLY